MSRKALSLIAAAAVLVAAGSAAAALRGGIAVTLHKTNLGNVLATSKGRTVYMYTPDGHDKSNCRSACAAIWPPLLTKGAPRAGAGVKQSLLGTTNRGGGKLQVTYAGHPLYSYTGDSRSGQATGEAYDGTWYALSAAGAKVKPRKAAGGGGGGGGGGGW